MQTCSPNQRVGAYLGLLEDQQTNGYYKVQDPQSGGPGWIYRTFVRRYPGEPPKPETKATPAKSPKQKKKDCPTTVANCPAEGCGGDAELNKLKNRTDRAQSHNPEEWSVDDIIRQNEESPPSWQRGRERSEPTSLGERTAVSVKGYIVHAKQESPESCNCYVEGDENNDIHINLLGRVPESDADRADSVVVEITPRFHLAGWTIDKLRTLRKNKAYVKITGWLLYDSMHGPSGSRATSWEIHPITRFDVCTSTKPACDQGNGWQKL